MTAATHSHRCPICAADLDPVTPEERAAHVYACQRENRRQLEATIARFETPRASRPRQAWSEELD